MNSLKLEIDNVKCGGCANSIKSSLSNKLRLKEVDVNLERSEIVINHPSDIDRDNVISLLRNLGYPEKGTGNGINKIKSYVSCAMGKMS